MATIPWTSNASPENSNRYRKRTIDIVAEQDGKRVAYEIETGKSDAEANVRKCLKAGMDRVVVLARSKHVTAELSNIMDPRVHVREIRNSEFNLAASHF